MNGLERSEEVRCDIGEEFFRQRKLKVQMSLGGDMGNLRKVKEISVAGSG